MNIGFLTNKLTLRGCEIALYDYAHYNEVILGNKSFIIARPFEQQEDVDLKAYEKFTNRFGKIEYYSSQKDIDVIVSRLNISHLYVIKSGEKNDNFSNNCKNLIHCVFSSSQKHGDVYSVLGKTINDLHSTQYPVVPFMIDLPCVEKNLKKDLNIPEDAVVFGRYGGYDSFDIDFVHQAIIDVLKENKNIYFLFMNTREFFKNEKIIFLPGESDMIFKRKFINTCDALIHSRLRGETFGLTCGEFAVCEKPVITFDLSNEREHLIILGDQAIKYNNKKDLYEILLNFRSNNYNMKNNGYKKYTPENVMKIFKEVYLKN
jgi:glycosyltransferase involved in cell wall biosynthesis